VCLRGSCPASRLLRFVGRLHVYYSGGKVGQRQGFRAEIAKRWTRAVSHRFAPSPGLHVPSPPPQAHHKLAPVGPSSAPIPTQGTRSASTQPAPVLYCIIISGVPSTLPGPAILPPPPHTGDTTTRPHPGVVLKLAPPLATWRPGPGDQQGPGPGGNRSVRPGGKRGPVRGATGGQAVEGQGYKATDPPGVPRTRTCCS
jgi:hypothetical protein